MARNRRKDGSPRKPSARALEFALALATEIFALNAGADSSDGRLADEVIGPLLWDYRRLAEENEQLKRDLATVLHRPTERRNTSSAT